ncbi:MAG TPA: glycosyltransferase, partial [Acidimicrobiia bacterium]
MTLQHCVYATSGWGIHDVRWTDALRSLGFEPTIVRLGIDASTPAELRHRVDEAAGPHVPVLAGPLDSVTSHLIGIKAPIIGLSWGFDLHTMSDRSWLPELHGLIVDSDATARIATSAGVAPAAITFLPWGVDIDRFTPDGPHADLTRWGVPKSARTVLSLRAHEPLYRVLDILEGFARTSREATDLHLLIGHSGSLTDELRAHARELGIEDRTHFIGSLPEEDLPALLRVTDVYVSASEVDGTSVTLLQAMACGTPVLVSDTPGNTSWIQEGETGHVFQTGKAQDLARELIAALEDPL